ncbi:MAG: hypothetical protein ABGX16_09855 [Pirellulales bacterium]
MTPRLLLRWCVSMFTQFGCFANGLLGISLLIAITQEGVWAVERERTRWKLFPMIVSFMEPSIETVPTHSKASTPSEKSPGPVNRTSPVDSTDPVNQTDPVDGFHKLFSLAYPGRAPWKSLMDGHRITTADFPFLLQLLFRLRQLEADMLDRWTQSDPPLSAWVGDPGNHRAELAWVTGNVLSMEKFKIPSSLTQRQQVEYFYLCQLRLGPQQIPATVITPQVPQCWLSTDSFPQPVRLRGLFLKTWQPTTAPHQITAETLEPALLLLTAQLAWFPTDGAPPGQLFLAAHGMDVALLDEVRQRQAFVGEEVSREKEAFYACLASVGQASIRELLSAAQQNLPEIAEHWGNIQQESGRQLLLLQQNIASANSKQTGKSLELVQLERERKKAVRQVALATAVLQRASQGHYSVGPLFLEPQEQVGHLTIVEGTARRAVKIVLPADPWSHYYELEIFTADSQNLPVVCCVSRLPVDFPLGDTIRKPVRMAGIFFKSWLYRNRQKKGNNESDQQLRLSVPLVIGAQVELLPPRLGEVKRWPWSAWIGLLVLLVVFWTTLIWKTSRNRKNGRLAASRLPRRWLDANEDRSS